MEDKDTLELWVYGYTHLDKRKSITKLLKMFKKFSKHGNSSEDTCEQDEMIRRGN